MIIGVCLCERASLYASASIYGFSMFAYLLRRDRYYDDER